MSKLFNKISVIGLGYVGLPLSLQFARSGIKVLGFDLDPQKLNLSILVNLISNIFLPKVLPSRSEQVVLRQRLSRPAYQRWMRSLYVFPLRWMIIANPIFLSFSKPPGPLPLTYPRMCLLVLNQPLTQEQQKKNYD